MYFHFCNLQEQLKAVSILAALLAQRPEAWTLENPTRESVVEGMTQRIAGCELNDIPLVRWPFQCNPEFLRVSHTDVVWYWTVFVLAYSTSELNPGNDMDPHPPATG